MKKISIYINLLIVPFVFFSCGVEEIKDPRLEVAIISPRVNPTTARSIVLKDQKFVYEARVKGGESSSYKWLVDDEQIATTLRSDSISYDTEGFRKARFEAANNSYEGSAEVLLYVVERAASFEDLPLAENSFWAGVDNAGTVSTFTSGNIPFSNTSPKDTIDYLEFGYSNITDSTNVNYANYGVFQLIASRNNYGIARTPESGKLKMMFDGEYSPMSIEVANNPLVVQTARGDFDIYEEDDTTIVSFANGDFYNLEIRGLLDDTTTTETVISSPLVSKSSNILTVQNSWLNQELITLGLVKGLEFTINTSKVDSTGVITYPTRFNIDNLILLNDGGEIINEINN
ncbi:DUF4465 domain-containing protein [Flammeovirga yaeyamensis]|uniref:DUF4465 domain-containing protein n=1 Tax=Flammeovirga yaeyamensis TaxID=367791 RepID=A0AAX1N429_9BACT|nr:DUF4465 domain-containing protein [Flammeovirga yaeyamensis]MBB3699673.1 hypothetical protein [Flammeovirga yaeyamensis]NMF36757.1 DUF4465 domain-containing protein [Flammeovirga yaeyamensis]QWG02202.1 DUF4465 domain-containing protein [Flammeovirga yaeyamensis]